MTGYDIELKCGCGGSLSLGAGEGQNQQCETRHNLDEFQKAHRACLGTKPGELEKWLPIAEGDPAKFVTTDTLLDIATDLRVRADVAGASMKTTSRLLKLIATSIEGTVASLTGETDDGSGPE